MHILNEIVKSRTVRRLGENSVQNVAWVTTTQKQDAGRFFEGEIGGQRYSHPPANDTLKHLKWFLNLRTHFWGPKIIQ